jgi:oligopeptide transport system substrate-binding protein
MPTQPALFITLLLATAAHCAHAATVPPGVQLHATQMLVRNNGFEPESLDPALVESAGANNITRDLFEGLTANDATGRIVPGVAESWKQQDATTWTFKLRHDALWSNGDPVTADDFVYGIRRFLDPKTASSYAATFGIFFENGMAAVKGQKPVTAVGVKALDKYTLVVRTNGVVPFLPSLMSRSNLGPVHQKTIEKFGKEWTRPGNMVGNGAFTLKEWSVNSKVVLQKNPRYWDAKNVQLEQVTYLPIEDENTQVKLYEAGQMDWTNNLPAGTFAKFREKYPKDIRNQPILGLRYYSMQTNDPALRDVRVRKALSMVIDRDILAQRVTDDGQTPAYDVVVRGTADEDVAPYEWAAWPMARRVQEAAKLLRDAGVKPGTKLTLSYNTSDYQKKMAVFAQSEWKSKLGLDIALEAVEFRVLLKRRHDGAFQISRDGWLADYNDATTFLALVRCDSDQNVTQSCNREAEKLIVEGTSTADPEKRRQSFNRAARMIMDGYPIIPLLQNSLPRLVKPYVGGYSEANMQDQYRSKDIYIVRH